MADTYASVEDLAALLRVSPTTFETSLQRVLDAATGEVDNEIQRPVDDPLAEDWELALAGQVTLERAKEHWDAVTLKFGIIPVGGDFALRVSRDTWEPYANKLTPLKRAWGLA